MNASSYSTGVSKQRVFPDCRRHRSIDESRLDGQNCDVRAEQAGAQALQEDLDAALGRAIDIVRLPAPVPGHRRDYGNASLALGFKLVRKDREECDSRREIDMQRFQRLLYILLAEVLIRESAMRNQRHIDASEGGDCRFDHGAMAGNVPDIKGCSFDPSRSPDPKVIGNCG